MSELVVLAFPNESGALQAREILAGMQKEGAVFLEDAAVVTRKADGQVKINQAVNLVGAGTLGGSFWGLLIGMLFMAPWIGLAVGAGLGALAGKKIDIGVDDEFIEEVAETIKPGHSALFLLVGDVISDRVPAALEPLDVRLLRTSLSDEEEARLREAFS